MNIALRISGFLNLPYDDSVNDFLLNESSSWLKLVSKYPSFKIEPRIKSVSSKNIESIQNETKRLTNIGNINLLSYYTLFNVNQEDVDDLFLEIKKIEGFEPLYYEETIPAKNNSIEQEQLTNEPLYNQQTYLHGNNEGIDIDSVRNINGNRGDYIEIKVIEDGCFTQHPDLVGLNLGMVGNNTTNNEIGTAVATIIAAQENGIGMTGITPNISHMGMYSPTYNGGKIGALIYAILGCHDRCILLISDQHQNFNGQSNLPYEVAEDLRDAIKLAVARDIIVIQAAGDGGRNLDSFEDYHGRRIFEYGNQNYDQTDAIMVASSLWGTFTGKHVRSSTTNFGNCVKGFAQGENLLVGTTNQNSPLPYYGVKSGTALAAAIVAGSILSFKGMVLREKGFNFKMRMLLQIWSFVGINDFDLSRMPIMSKFYRFVKDVVDIYSRDYIGDIGQRNITGKLQSPDIIISDRFISDPQGSFGTGSGNENKFLNVNVEYGQDNYCYVRISNRSGNTAISNIVNLYFNNSSPLASPKSWKLIGQAFIERAEPGVITVSPAIKWSANKLPKKGHYCFIAIIENVFDPAPDHFNITSSQQFIDFIKNNNNATWRNFNVVDNNPSNTTHPSREINEVEFTLDFFRNDEMSLKINSNIPTTGKILFEFPDDIAPYISGSVTNSNYRSGMKQVEISTPCFDLDLIKNKVLNLRDSSPFKLQYYIPRNNRNEEYSVELVQYYKNEIIGRLTWMIKSLNQGEND